MNEIKEGPEAHEVVKSTMPKLLHTHAQARAHKVSGEQLPVSGACVRVCVCACVCVCVCDCVCVQEAKRARMTSLVEQESSDPIQPQISSLEVVKDGLDLNLAG